MINFFIKPKQLFWGFLQYLLAVSRQVNIAGRTLQISAVFLFLLCSTGSVWGQQSNVSIWPLATSGGTWSGTTVGPYTFTPNANSASINVTDIVNRLQGTGGFAAHNVTIITTCAACTQTGSIALQNNITVTPGATQRTLTFTAAASISLGSNNISMNGANPATNLTLTAGAAGSVSSTGGVIDLDGAHATKGNIIINSATNSTLASTISGGNLTKQGVGRLELSGANDYIGTTTISAGTIRVGHATALGTTAGATTVASGAVLDLNGNAISENLTINGTGISSGGALINGLSSTPATVSGTVALGSTAPSVGGTGDIDITGVVSGSTTLTKVGTGDLTLSGTNTLSGATIINAGTIIVNNIDALGTTVGNTTISSGATLDLNGFTTAEPLILSGTISNGSTTAGTASGTITLTTAGIVNSGNDITLSGIISSTGTLTKSGTGALTLSGTNTYSAATTISAGTIIVNNVSALGTTAGNTTVSSGAILDLNGFTIAEPLVLSGTISNGSATAATESGAITLTGAGIVNSDNDITLSGIISSTGTLTKSGTGTLTLSNANTYTGTTTISSGTLKVGHASALGGNTALQGTTINTGGTLDLNGFTIAEPLTMSGGTLSNSGATASTESGAITLSTGTSNTVNGASNITLSGAIIGAGSLVKSGSNTLTLSAAGNAYTGSTTVNDGILTISASGRIPDASALTVNSPGTFDMGGFNETVGSIAGTGTITSVGAATLTTGGDNTSTSFSGAITGAVALNKTGTGTLTLLGAANTYTGNTTISAGILALGANDIIPNGSNVILAGGTLNTAGFSDDMGTLTVSAASSMTLGNAGTIRFSGVGTLSNNLAITGYVAGTTQVFVGTSSILSSTDLSKITINGAAVCQINTGEITPAATISIVGGGDVPPPPGSATFTQTGSPSGGTWSVSPGGLGTIDASTGVFVPTATSGVITVTYTSTAGCASSMTTSIGNDGFSIYVPDILFNATAGCLSTATKETGCTSGISMENLGAGTNFADNFLNHCAFQNAGCTGTAATQYNKTDFNDLWYKVALPTGTTQMTLSATGITGSDHIAFGLYTAQPIDNNSHNAVTDANISGNASRGGAFFNSTQTSHLITNLTAGGTYYVRVMGALADNTSASVCASIPHPCFTISATAPQENDACGNAINITTNNGGAAHTGNYAASNSESGDEWNSCPVSAGAFTAAGDLWYSINYPDFPSVVQEFYTELTLNGTAGEQVRVVVYNTTTACGGTGTASEVAYCEVVTLTGANFTTNLPTPLGNLLTTDNFSRYVQIIPIGTVGSVTASATVVFKNNSCSQFNNTLPGFDLDNGSFPIDMTYATASGIGGISGKDLWYQVSTTNKQSITFTITDDNDWSGNLSLILYEYPGTSVDCNNLTMFCQQTGITEFQLISGRTFNLSNGNYLLRVVETANTAGTLNVTLTGTTSATVILPNSTCSTSVPDITNGNQTGNLTQAQLPCPNTSLTLCNGLPVNSTPFDAHYGAKLYYKFTMPNDLCPSLAASTRRTSATISFSGLATLSGAGTKDVYLQLYETCGGTPIACVSGANNTTPRTFNNLVGGTTYYLEVINNTLSTTGTANFTIQQVTFPDPVPCNDKPENAQALRTLPNCPSVLGTSYTSLPTYSAQGATPEVGGSSDKTVWFKFTAPSPANGGVYSGLSARSWVTVFLEGQSAHNIEMELYLTGGTTIATGQTTTYSVNGVGDRTWGKFGNLEPGVEYWVRLKHNELPTVNVLYKIDIWAGGMQNDFAPLACGNNASPAGVNAQLCGSCGDLSYDAASGQVPSSYNSNTLIDQSLCEEYYKIDLPLLNAHTTKYWVVEVRGFKQMLDFELRKQVITETINPGGADYDHPCWSRPLADEEFISSFQKGYDHNGTAYNFVNGDYLSSGSCNDLVGVAPHSGGFRKVYKGLSGSVDIPFTKNYYFLRVFMNPNDPQAATCEQNGGIHTCQVIFKGPYNTQAAAEAGGAPDGGACGTIVANTTNAANDFNHTLINTPVSGTVALNDYDLEGNTQTYTTTPVTNPTNGSVTINANGTYTYTPTTGYTGQDSFVYQVCDNGTPQACDNATVYIEILANPTTANEPPIANPDHYLTEINTAVSGSIISNDSDPDGNPITINTTPVTNPTSGSVTINANGTYTYTPNTGFTGTDSFVYSICDNGTSPLCDQATVTIDVIPNNGNITFAGDDSGIGMENTIITGNVLANDFDAEGNTITLNTTPLTNPSNGTVILLPNGTFTYTPATDFVGNNAFTYQICDNGTPQACDVATVHLTVLPSYAIAGTLFNDPNGLSNSLVDGTGIGTASGTQMYANLVLGGIVIKTVTLAAGGTYSFTGLSAGSYTVVIATSATATSPSVASGWTNVGEAFGTNNGAGTGNDVDGMGVALTLGSVLVTVGSSDVTGVNFGIANNSTNAANDFNHTLINTPVLGTVALNDYDLEGNTQTYTTTPITLPAHGSVTINTDGTYTYTPTTGNPGQDSFVYQVCDNGTPQACDNATVYIEILANPTTANEPPIANPDHYLTEINTPVSGSIISNDSDPDGNPITINTTPITNPTNGLVTINANGTYTYTPNTGFTGTDSFVYSICDNGTPPLCDQATVTIDVIPNNGNITFAGDDSGIGMENTIITGNVLGNDFDAEGNAITLNITPLTDPNQGAVTLLADGSFSYVPDNNYVGNDEFNYQICDNGTPQACDVATVHLTVLPTYAIAGNVFDDADGLNDTAVDGIGIGNPSSTQLYANVVNGSNVVATATVNTATGAYSVSGLVAGSYTVQISTNQGTVGNAAPAIALPTAWVNVGEDFGTGGSVTGIESGTPNGSIAVTIVSSDVTGVNFGISPAYSISGSVFQDANGGTPDGTLIGSASGTQLYANLLNSSGTLLQSVTIPTSGGSVGTYTFTNVASSTSVYSVVLTTGAASTAPGLPSAAWTNVGEVYGSNNGSGSGSATPINGIIPVTVGSADVSGANFGVQSSGYTLSGNVFDDADGLNDMAVDGIGIGNPSSTQLYANVVNGSNVVATATVNTATGAYSVSGLVAGSYTVQISTNQGTVGNAAPAIALPTAWVNVGEDFGTGGSVTGIESGTPNGSIAVTIVSSDVTNINFGIDSRPTVNTNVAANQTNPGGTTQVTVPATVFSGADAGDLMSTGLVTAIQIQYPTNATSIYINGVNYTAATFATAFPLGYTTVPTNSSGNPTQAITVDPSFDGAGSVVFTYYTVDNAGVVSAASATATVPFLGAGCNPNAGMWID